MLEEAQGADVQGRSIMVDFVGEKSQKGAKVGGKALHVTVNVSARLGNCPRSKKKLLHLCLTSLLFFLDFL